MPYNKESTIPRGFPEEIWISKDPNLIIKYLVEAMLPYWAMKMHLLAWGRYNSVHIEEAWIKQLQEAAPKSPIKPAILDQRKIL
jgi:hypothetical protein